MAVKIIVCNSFAFLLPRGVFMQKYRLQLLGNNLTAFRRVFFFLPQKERAADSSANRAVFM